MLTITNSYFDVSDQDYTINLVNTGIIHDVWIDAFEIGVLSMPPALLQYNSQSAWKLELNTLAPTLRTLTCYGAKVYSCIPDTTTGELNVLRYNILSTSTLYQHVVVSGDQTDRFK